MNDMEETFSVKTTVNLTPSLAAFVDKAAGIEEMSRSEYIRMLIEREKRFTERPFIKWLLGRFDSRWRS